MKKLIIHNGFFRMLIPPLTGIIIYLLILLLNNDVNNLSNIFSGQEVYVCIGISYLTLETLGFLTFLFDTYIKNILVFLLLGVIVSILVATLTTSAYFKLILEFSISDNQLIIFNTAFGFLSLLYNLLFISQVFLQKQNKNRLNEEKLLTQSLESEFNQFKNEVNPDLLYDSLETLITLAHKDVEETEDYIDQLSLVYRYILSHRKVEFVSIKEDLKASESIIYLLQNKNHNAIFLIDKLDDKIKETLIIPGALPNLIENIIRNSIITNDSALTLTLTFDNDEKYIVLEHKQNPKLNQISTDFRSVLEESYTIYSDKPLVEVNAYGMNYIKIPLLEVEFNTQKEAEAI